MSAFLDSNVVLYRFDDDVPEKQARAHEVLAEHADNGVISTQVMIETHSVLTRKLGRTREFAQRVLDALEFDVVPTDPDLVLRAADTATAHQLSIFDALILEAAAAAGCDELLTEDLADGTTLRGVRIRNPFADL